MGEEFEEGLEQETAKPRKQKEILQTIFDHIPLMITFMDQDGRIRWINRASEQTLGWTLEEIQDMDLPAALYPDHRERERAMAFVNTKGTWRDFKPTTRDGRVLDTSWFMMHLSDGTVIGIGQDVTTTKRTEAALRESVEPFRQLAENIHEVVWLTSADFREIFYVSPAFEAVWGLSCEAVIQDSLVVIHATHPEDRPIVLDFFQRPPQNAFEIEYRIIRPDAGVRWLRGRGFPIRNPDGAIHRFAGITEDITERKRSEERLKSSTEQLRALSARLQSVREEEKSRIARGIHDEFGAALTSLKWELEGIEKAAPNLSDRVRGMVRLIDSTMKSVQRIISELRPQVLDDLGLLEAIEWQAQQFQAQTGIPCPFESHLESVNLNRDESTAVFRIVQEALTNILRHAAASQVRITLNEYDGTLFLRIADNGRGITHEEKTRLSSLGLLGIKERVSLVGGDVAIEGESGKGTTVVVRIPHRT